VELDQVEVVGLEATQAPLDAGEQRRRAPVRAPPAASMAALGEEVELPPPGAERPPNEDLAPAPIDPSIDKWFFISGAAN